MPVEPQYSDESWLAIDADGNVGWFTVNGAGAVLLRPGIDTADLFVAEDLLAAWLRDRARPFVFGDGKQWDAAADAGLFAFDYSVAADGYELRARPASPIPWAELPPELAPIAELTKFVEIRFAATPLLTTSDLTAEDG